MRERSEKNTDLWMLVYRATPSFCGRLLPIDQINCVARPFLHIFVSRDVCRNYLFSRTVTSKYFLTIRKKNLKVTLC